MFFFFFFQAEDGIRDKLVTGVQTCALPISAAWSERALAWNESCRTLGERLKLGALRASSVDSSAGAVQLMHEEAATTIALAPAGGNLGFVRSRLRTAPSLKEQ